MSFFDKPWKYINEGNVHIVVQIVGTNHVLRLIKEDGKQMDLRSVQDSVNFVNLVMIPLLFYGNCDRQELLELSQFNLSELQQKITKFRPEYRRHKSLLSSYVIRAPNLAVLSPKCAINYCLEIKPKEGFISSAFIEHSKCYYCLKQVLKLKLKQIEEISHYCPLDLFSGDRARMKQALVSLVSNPQNNFKLFKDGSIIYDAKSLQTDFHVIVTDIFPFRLSDDSLNLFLDFIIEILLSTCESNIILEESEEVSLPSSKQVCVECNILEKNMFLHKILTLQKISENVNLNVIVEADEDFNYVSSILEELKIENLNLNTEEDRLKFFTATNPKNLALISAIAKDCSIMISFSPNFEEGFSTIQVGENKVPYKVSVTDLEPKPTKALIKRKKTEEKLLAIHEKYSESSK